ncbi:uncharacterized protein LOC124142739 [Haliotis rufescens]|uniref:uncharacterized protein LOC124142739 n=1 Tax=Haliotis rufescens TaxID=6454 RepID=UPI001EB063A1|nr:uncharacterized protein LOC124142739 [Haliotis rufescens]
MRHFTLQGTYCIVFKMVAIYIFLICVVSSALAKDPPKCCLRDSWQAYAVQPEMLSLDPMPFLQFYSDLILKKEAQQTFQLTPGSAPVKSYRMVTDHSKGRTYRISPAGVCTSFPNIVPMIPCIPDSATFLGESYVGAPKIGVAFNVWRFSIEPYKLNITLSVAQDSCIPILERISSPNVNISLSFSGFSSPLYDKSVFDVPSGC